MGDESFYQSTLQRNKAVYLNFEATLFRDECHPLRFSYPADHPLTAEFEEQMIGLAREYKGVGEYLSIYHPDEQGASDDAPNCTALMAMDIANGNISEHLFGCPPAMRTFRHRERQTRSTRDALLPKLLSSEVEA